MLAVLTSLASRRTFSLELSSSNTPFSASQYLASQGWDTVSPVVFNLLIPVGVVCGSLSPLTPALSFSLYPGSTVVLTNYGTISGMGGTSGGGSNSYLYGNDGLPGGTAVLTTVPLIVWNFGTIQGGGGGGAGSRMRQVFGSDFVVYVPGAPGGGGAGAAGGSGNGTPNNGYIGNNGFLNIGGLGKYLVSYGYNGYASGQGGFPGGAGQNAASGELGGAAGNYINGNALTTWANIGTRWGGAI